MSPTEDSIASLTEAGVFRLWTTANPEEVNQHQEHWIQRLNDYISLGQLDRASTLLAEALKRNPDSLELHLRHGELLQQLVRTPS